MEHQNIIKSHNHKDIKYPPGGILIWFIIIMELITFITGILFYFSYRQNNMELFLEMQKKLNLNFAIVNTLFLVTSGYLVAMAHNCLEEKKRVLSRQYLLGGIVLGFGFIFLKSFEYDEKIEQGLTIHYNSFFTFYWFLTVFHYMHVLFTTFILIFIYFKLKKETKDELPTLEIGGTLWHMCDLIWILLFPTLFLIR